MTQINTIPPKALTDQHLIAEHHVITRPINLAIKKYNHHGRDLSILCSEIPDSYRNGTGHVIFFYDKLKYITIRSTQIKEEMEARGFDTHSHAVDSSMIPSVLYNDWKPSEYDKALNASRLRDKILDQSGIKWRFHKTPISLGYIRTLDDRTEWVRWLSEFTQLGQAQNEYRVS